MISQAHITAWRETAPWGDDAQVEQDLVLSRAVVEVFAEPGLVDALALRGGTALNKLLIQPPSRYSQDIDLVQVKADAVQGTGQREIRECAKKAVNLPNGLRDRPGLPNQSSEPGRS